MIRVCCTLRGVRSSNGEWSAEGDLLKGQLFRVRDAHHSPYSWNVAQALVGLCSRL